MKRTGPRVADVATRHLHLEETVAFDSDVEGAAGRLQVAAAEVARGCHGTDAQTGFEPNRRLRRRGGRRARHFGLVVDQILEFDAGLLEAGRIDVGEVVRHVIDVLLLGAHPAGGCIQRANHFGLLIAADLKVRTTVVRLKMDATYYRRTRRTTKPDTTYSRATDYVRHF